VKVSSCIKNKILEPCSLEGFGYQLDLYTGCEHLCCYCYGLNKAVTKWDEEVLIHDNLEERLFNELASLEPQVIYIGMNSDPYQQSEAVCDQTSAALELLAAQGFSASVLTKSGLITRDTGLFKKMPFPAAGISVAFNAESTRKRFEKNAPPTKERIKALGKMKEAGIKTYTLICPVLPYITDVEALLELVTPCSDEIWVYKLEMNAYTDPNWQNLKLVLEQFYPDLLEKFKEIVFSPGHEYWEETRTTLEKLRPIVAPRLIIEV